MTDNWSLILLRCRSPPVFFLQLCPKPELESDPDGGRLWVTLEELTKYADTVLLNVDPASYSVQSKWERGDLATVPANAGVFIDSPEFSRVLVTLHVGPLKPGLTPEPLHPRPRP